MRNLLSSARLVDNTGALWEKARWELHKYARCSFGQILEVLPHETAAL